MKKKDDLRPNTVCLTVFYVRRHFKHLDLEIMKNVTTPHQMTLCIKSIANAVSCQRVAKHSVYGFHYKLAPVCFICTRCRDPFRRGRFGVRLWLKASCDSHGWLSKSVIPKNEQCKQATGLLGALAEARPAFFWTLKGKHMGLTDNKNRALPLLSIMCDLSDLIFISFPLPLLKRWATVSIAPFQPFSPSKSWMGNRLFRGWVLCLDMKPQSYASQWH